jgi:hypothetical protein
MTEVGIVPTVVISAYLHQEITVNAIDTLREQVLHPREPEV